MNPYTFLALSAVALGAAIGSFWNVAIARLPHGHSLVHPGSRCPVCETPIQARDNIPVISWLLLGARCRACGTPISARYPLVESLGAALAYLCFRRFVPTPQDIDIAHLVAWAFFFLSAGALVVSAYTDLRWRVIPEHTSVWAIPAAVGGHALLQALGYDGWLAIGWRGAVLGCFSAWALLAGFRGLFRLVRGVEGLGWGDVRLIAFMGAVFGPDPMVALRGDGPGVWGILLLASISASIGAIAHLAITRNRTPFAFGPYLSLAGIVWMLYGDVLLP